VNPHPKPAHAHGHHPPHAPHRAGRGSSRKVTNNLVALGSAAVLAVYAAGFIRTRSAAQRFEGDGGGRRQPLPTKQVASATPSETPTAIIPSADPIAPAVALTPASEAATTSSAVVTTSTPSLTPATTEPSPAPVVVAAVEPWVPAAATLPVPPPPLAAPAPLAPAAPAVPAAPAAQDSAAAAESKSIWKDGKYSGWGSCRHGDIGATVEIKDGRIVSAIISSCRTVYSCDVIDKVIPQVVMRQSADIDSVSGATQSADAFFWAVSSALDDAKAAMASTKAALTTAK